VQIGQLPGSIASTFGCTRQVNDTALVTRIKSRRQIGQAPAAGFVTWVWTLQLQTSARRIGTSVIAQIGQAPGLSSTTSACIAQVYDTGGTLIVGGGSAGGWPAASISD
jgi:saccharopine dehydrogenase-like NADP-dependent oxidoreductase